MGDELTTFFWTVPAAGFEWIDAPPSPLAGTEATNGRVLHERSSAIAPANCRLYDPLSRFTGLFRTFAAQTAPDETGVLKFANRYGWLGIPIAVLRRTTRTEAVQDYGESLDQWIEEILTMGMALRVWDLCQSGNSRSLGRYVRWQGGSRVLFEYTHPRPLGKYRKVIAADMINPEPLKRFMVGDTIAPAMWLLREIVNKKLQDFGVYPQLLWNRDSLSLRLVPQNLIGCLWLQFAKAIEGKKQYRQCEYCRLWFEVGGTRAARSDKRFCNPTCKAAAHRRKQNGVRDGKKEAR